MPRFKPSRAAALLAVFGWLHAHAVEFVFVNADGNGEGLNDPTPVAPVGGNPGTTRGQQRLAVLQKAGELWGAYLVGNVPIRVEVQFSALAANTLAGASIESLQENFANAPHQNIWYPVALANQLAGVDLEPSEVDISVTANSNGAFYYGLDTGNPGGLSNFVEVMLHELGHGLGFINSTNFETGNFVFGQADIYSLFTFDKEFNAAWPALTASQRVTSAKNDPDLVWTGPFTSAGLPFRLDRQFQLSATLPNQTNLPLTFVNSGFAAPLSPAMLTGQLAITSPSDACGPITNAAALAGKIAFIRRGSCDFDSKVYKAQQAGAVGVIMANNVDDALFTMSGDGIVDGQPVEFTIPAVFISRVDGDALLNASPGVQVSLAPGSYVGTNGNQLRLHAPATLSLGSSVSHWSNAAAPNLVMEPIINPGLDRKLDLTLTQMKDIGWTVIDIPFPHLTFDTWKTRFFTTGETMSGPADDPDRDGADNLEEYFFDNHPKVPDLDGLPVFQLTGGLRKFSYTRSKLFTDLDFELEKSTSLQGFVEAVLGVDYVIESTTDLGTDAERVTLRLLNPPSKLFLRLRIER